MNMVKDKPAMAGILARHKGNIALWTGFFAFVVFSYHFFSDGDFSFLMTFGAFVRAFGFGILIFKSLTQKSVAGLSLKTLQLYAFVFFFRLCSITRYQGYLPYDRSGDWLYTFIEFLALALTAAVIFLVTVQFRGSYDFKYDTFGHLHVPSEYGIAYILVPCILLGMLIHPNLNLNWFADVSWTIALYIEAIAILPQLFMFQKRGGGTVESCISHWIYALAFGSFLHLWFWLFSYHELGEKNAGHHVGYTVIFVQIGHMLMMGDFLYYYFKSMKDGGPMMLPTHGDFQA
ncbi:unnamed protein product [Aphanomyces euteiches]|uniref:ER lumen protein-retaining receptor n=1 Tax=Aphanomyces euteiches TaxID=100861 RepID=A0A6G0WXS3_9STRA|nr:hypothetical protein Ae201684_010586 [Aphanomyces euteiches]KAH9089922.1 hypothetical protein Ae201684P_014677 [Aphanomyces euteiches]KAH9145405.1 hypothetical protein AeRB84_010758 [Aphanomyces euteiches]